MSAVVAARTADGRIILAADSAATSYNDAGICAVVTGPPKINPCGRWWATLCGVSRIEDLDVEAVLYAALTPADTLHEARVALERAFRDVIRPRLLEALETGAGRHAMAGPPFVLVVAGLDADGTAMLVFGCGINPTGQLDSFYATCPSPGGEKLFVGASARGGIPLPADLATFTTTRAREILRAEIAATPDRVKWPLTIVELTTTGETWHQYGED
jgi:hypothetical protein